MSEFEDRQDATPAIDTPTATTVSASTTTAEAVTDAADDTAASLSERDDLEAIAAVEGVAEPDAEPEVEAFGPQLAPIYPEVSDAAVRADEAPLLDDALEDGIASVFAALQAAARDGDIGEADEPAGALSDDEAHDGITFRLLGELDRLWHRAA